MKTKVLPESKRVYRKSRRIIRKSELVAFPTETVYGLGGNALDKTASQKIYEAKGRPSDNPLIVHIAEIDEIYSLCDDIPESFFALANRFWPGPLTIILKKSDAVPSETTGGLESVAVRMPSHPVARELIKKCGVPIAAPSANSSGKPSPTKASHVYEDLKGKIPLIIDGGECKFGVESTIISIYEDVPTLLRPGAITLEQLREVLGEVKIADAVLSPLKSGEQVKSPGMKYKHYSPKADVIIIEGEDDEYISFLEEHKNETSAYALLFKEEAEKSPVPYIVLGSKSDDLSQAANLFDALRSFDKKGAKTVYAHSPRKSGVGLAVYNRLIRAAGFKVIKL